MSPVVFLAEHIIALADDELTLKNQIRCTYYHTIHAKVQNRYKCQDHKISFISPLAPYLREQTIVELQQRTYKLDVIRRGFICLIPWKKVWYILYNIYISRSQTFLLLIIERWVKVSNIFIIFTCSYMFDNMLVGILCLCWQRKTYQHKHKPSYSLRIIFWLCEARCWERYHWLTW